MTFFQSNVFTTVIVLQSDHSVIGENLNIAATERQVLLAVLPFYLALTYAQFHLEIIGARACIIQAWLLCIHKFH